MYKVGGAIMFLLGLALLTLASIYFFTPAGAIPRVLPGYAYGSSDLHPELGLSTAIVSLFVFAMGWLLGFAGPARS